MTEFIQIYIEKMKESLGVSTDKEASMLLGISENEISTWRKRNRIPLDVEITLIRKFGNEFIHDPLTREFLSSREDRVVHAATMHAYARFHKRLGRETSTQEKLALGAIFAKVEKSIRKQVRILGLDDDPIESVLGLIIFEIENGLFSDVERLFEEAIS